MPTSRRDQGSARPLAAADERHGGRHGFTNPGPGSRYNRYLGSRVHVATLTRNLHEDTRHRRGGISRQSSRRGTPRRRARPAGGHDARRRRYRGRRHRRSARPVADRNHRRRALHAVGGRRRCRPRVPPRGGRERSGGSGVRPRDAGQRRRDAGTARRVPPPREAAPIRVLELARGVRRPAACGGAGRCRRGPAVVVRLREGDCRTPRPRVFEKAIRGRHRLPPADRGDPSRCAQRRRFVVREQPGS